MTAFLLSIIAALAAFGGGILALKGRKKLNATLGFTAGVILGLVAFDLLPEIFNISQSTNLDPTWPMITLVTGFLLFHIIEKFILLHHPHEKDYGPHVHPHVGIASALALSGHSFLDGVAIGVAFQVNNVLGTAVAIAVISHRFADGFNTTNVMLQHRNNPKRARNLLIIAAVMPYFGRSSNTAGDFLGKIPGCLYGLFRRLLTLHWGQRHIAAGPQQKFFPHYNRPDCTRRSFYVRCHPPGLSLL